MLTEDPERKRVGLWVDNEPKAPWDFRKATRY